MHQLPFNQHMAAVCLAQCSLQLTEALDAGVSTSPTYWAADVWATVAW